MNTHIRIRYFHVEIRKYQHFSFVGGGWGGEDS